MITVSDSLSASMYQHDLYVQQTAEDILRDALDQKFHRAVPEIATYLKDSFGNPIRIDYGTGKLSNT